VLGLGLWRVVGSLAQEPAARQGQAVSRVWSSLLVVARRWEQACLQWVWADGRAAWPPGVETLAALLLSVASVSMRRAYVQMVGWAVSAVEPAPALPAVSSVVRVVLRVFVPVVQPVETVEV
jgi:hypothetical protein